MNVVATLILYILTLLSPVECIAKEEKMNVVGYFFSNLTFQIYVIMIVCTIFVINYHSYIDKQKFFKSNLFKSFVYPLLTIFLVALMSTIVFDYDKKIYKEDIKEEEVEEKEKEIPKVKIEEVEEDYFNLKKHFDFIDYSYYYYSDSIDNDIWIKNYYHERLQGTEDYQLVSKAALGYIYFKKSLYDSTLFYLNSIKYKDKEPVLYYYLATAHLKTNFADSTILYYEKLLTFPPLQVDSCYKNYAVILKKFNRYDLMKNKVLSNNRVSRFISYDDYVKLFNYYKKDISVAVLSSKFKNKILCRYFMEYLVKKDDYAMLNMIRGSDLLIEKYMPEYVKKKLMVMNLEVWNYYKDVYANILPDIRIEVIIASLLIALMWIYYITNLDIFQKSNLTGFVGVFVFNFLFSDSLFFVYDYYKYVLEWDMNGEFWNDLWYTIFCIGFNEELMKAIPIIAVIAINPYLKKKILKEPFDYIILAVFAALGFAASENILYFSRYTDKSIILVRALYSSIGHIVFCSIVAYGFVLYKYRYKGQIIYIFLCFLMAMAIHGIYDFLLMNSFILYVLFFTLVFVYTTAIWLVMINNCLNNSPMFSYHLTRNADRIRVHIGMMIAGILLYEYILFAVKQGSMWANFYLVDVMAHESILIVFFVFKLASYDLVKNYWRPLLQFVDPGSKYERTNLLVFIYEMFSANSIISMNYVNYEISIYWDNSDNGFWARIIDRTVVDNLSEYKKVRYEDNQWFVIQTYRQLTEFGYTSKLFLLKLKDEYADLDNNEHIPVFIYVHKETNGEIPKIEDLEFFCEAYMAKNTHLTTDN